MELKHSFYVGIIGEESEEEIPPSYREQGEL